jgi:hypothetical protein
MRMGASAKVSVIRTRISAAAKFWTSPFLGIIMQVKLAHKDESAWDKGDLAYDLGDTLEMGPIKAAREGIRPGCNGYAAFLTAFARRVRSQKLSPRKMPAQPDSAQGGSAVVLTPDFARIGS